MFRFAMLPLLGFAAFAQTGVPPAEKPPADVDQALRARIDQFYTFIKNHEFRKAEDLIAEDTKDSYYEGSKPQIASFNAPFIQYSEHFTRASVITECVPAVGPPGFPPGSFTVKIPTTWRFENGNWYMYEDHSKVMGPLGNSKSTAPPADPAAIVIPKDLPPKPDIAIMGKVAADKEAVQLQSGASEEIHITNGLPGPIDLELGIPLKGIDAKLDRSGLGSGQQAVLTLTAGKEPGPGTYYLRIMPMGMFIPIQVQVK
jgi:hypothetical protein